MAGILRPSEYPLFPLQARFPAEARTRNTRMPAGVLLFTAQGAKFSGAPATAGFVRKKTMSCEGDKMLDTANPVRTDTHAQRKATVDRLTAPVHPEQDHPFLDIAWPESLPEDVMWMPQADDGAWHPGGRNADARAAALLSKWESIWFYSSTSTENGTCCATC